MNKKTIIWIVICVLLVAVLFLTFKVTGSSASVPAAQSAAATAQSTYSPMVGGC